MQVFEEITTPIETTAYTIYPRADFKEESTEKIIYPIYTAKEIQDGILLRGRKSN